MITFALDDDTILNHQRAARAVVRRYMRYGVVREHEYEDMVQEVLLAVVEQRDNYDPGKCSVVAWVYSVGRSRISEIRRYWATMKRTGFTVSLDAPISDDGDLRLGDTIADPDASEPDDTAGAVRKAVVRALESKMLTPSNKPRERKAALAQADTLVKKRLLSLVPATLGECAAMHGVTRQAMQQREARLMKAVRRELKGVAA